MRESTLMLLLGFSKAFDKVNNPLETAPIRYCGESAELDSGFSLELIPASGY